MSESEQETPSFMRPSKRAVPRTEFPGEPSSPVASFLGFLGAAGLELAMLMLFYGTYSETMGMMSDVYLCDLPGAGAVFCQIDDEMTVSHLLAFLLAVFSIVVPLVIWSEIIDQQIFDDPGAWLASPANKVWTIIAAAVYGLVFLLETVNLYTLIARESAAGPFGMAGDANPLMEFLAANQGLGIFVAVMIAVVNAVLAFIAVRAVRNLKHAVRS